MVEIKKSEFVDLSNCYFIAWPLDLIVEVKSVWAFHFKKREPYSM